MGESIKNVVLQHIGVRESYGTLIGSTYIILPQKAKEYNCRNASINM